MYQNIKQYNKIFYLLIAFILNTLYLILYTGNTYAAQPSSTNFKLQNYSFGSGGINNGTSTNFGLFGVAGETEFGRLSSTNFKAGSGLIYMQTSNLPPAPTVTNPSNYYNRLKLVLATGNNPSDSLFAIAISPDNFSSTTKYVQTDLTLGNSPSWQTYVNWGSISGINVIGLDPNTTYTVKVAAKQGKFTQTAYGPTAQAATIAPTLSFSLSTNAVNIGTLNPGTVVTGGTQVTTTITTNSASGGIIYAYGSNNGLLSSSASYTISAVSSDLSGANEGYGLRAVSTTQGAGGPMEKLSPYNGIGDNVGALDSNKRPLFDSTNQPVTNGQGIFELKAKASNTTRAASDYTDVLTVIASATY